MTSTDRAPAVQVQGARRRSPPDQLHAPRVSCNKPLTPFSIEDILNKPSAGSRAAAPLSSTADEAPAAGHGRSDRSLLRHTSPLSALEELASKTFRGLEVSVLQAAEGSIPVHSGRDALTLFGQSSTPKKRRKSRTAFTNHQIYELEKRFLYQKYLNPADRDQIAQSLGLSNAQVITWFQNRRAKLKRDLEEMKADVESARAAGAVASEKLIKLAELEKCAARGAAGRSALAPGRPERGQLEPGSSLDRGPPCESQAAAASAEHSEPLIGRCCSEDEDQEIDVDDSSASVTSELSV